MAKGKGRKIRVDFRRNRQARARGDELTRRFRDESARDELVDSASSETVRAKGALSRKRTIIVDENEAPRIDEALWKPGIVVQVHGLFCRVEEPDGRSWDCTVRRVLRTMLIGQRAPITVGDRVWFAIPPAAQTDALAGGVIERVAPRQTLLTRGDRRHRAHAIVANADRVLIVASVAQPNLKPHLIDRYIVAAGKGGLQPIIAFNKCDLLAEEDAPAESPERVEAGVEVELEDDDYAGPPLTVADIFDEFAALGCRCLWTSAVAGIGIDELRDAFREHVTVVCGQSGVGKSSLINAVQPGLQLATAAVSAETEKGRHTTTLARLLRLETGGYVVDTPGIRAFDLWSVQPGELEAHFAEFLPLIQQCHFKDCHHLDEPDCAVRAAVDDGRVSVRRYCSYVKMVHEVSRAGRQ